MACHGLKFALQVMGKTRESVEINERKRSATTISWRIKMIMFRNILAAVSAVLLLGLASSYMPIAAAGDLPTEKGCKKLKEADNAMKGWCAAITRKKGNCLACHHAVVDNWPATLPPGGNIGPPFVAMGARFPNSEDLRAQIWDATVNNPNSSMPPFGKHKLISETDIDNIVAWLSTL
jgi:sulfur-oxidizing protein SoxX